MKTPYQGDFKRKKFKKDKKKFKINKTWQTKKIKNVAQKEIIKKYNYINTI